MPVKLTAGTKQFVNVDVDDGARIIDDLTLDGATDIKFDVIRASDSFAEYTDQATTASGMVIQCLIDTAGFQPEPHNLYVKFTLGSEDVVLGPYPFYIIA